MSDLIDRQDAIDAIDKKFGRCLNIPICKEIRDVAKETIKALPSAQPKPQWISCSKRLPDEKGEYLLTLEMMDGTYECDIDKFNGKKWYYYHKGDVVAWMPLPKYEDTDND